MKPGCLGDKPNECIPWIFHGNRPNDNYEEPMNVPMETISLVDHIP